MLPNTHSCVPCKPGVRVWPRLVVMGVALGLVVQVPGTTYISVDLPPLYLPGFLNGIVLGKLLNRMYQMMVQPMWMNLSSTFPLDDCDHEYNIRYHKRRGSCTIPYHIDMAAKWIRIPTT